MDKEVVVYIYNGIRLGMGKNEIWPFVTTWMELESVMLSEINQAGKDGCHMFALICGY